MRRYFPKYIFNFEATRLFMHRNYFLVIILIFVLYSMILIFWSSFIIENTRYFSLFDDEMVSMRYAYNFAHGYGLVWNQGGERIEGITNPAWTFYMSLVHLLPIPIEKISLVIQSTGAFAMILSLYFVKKIAEIISKRSKFVIAISVIFTAFYFPLNNWAVIQGTEVSVIMLIVCASSYLVLSSLKKKSAPLFLFVILGVGAWIRLDFIASAFVLLVMLFWLNSNIRNSHFLKGIVVFLLFIFFQVAIRYGYYQDFLPNTYYLKMVGYPLLNRITNGVYVTLKEINLLILVIPFIYLYFSKNKNILVLLIVFVTQLVYSVYVGGDAWEFFGGANRYVAIGIPLFFISLAYAIYNLQVIVKKHYVKYFQRYKAVEIFSIFFLFILLNSQSDNMLLYLLTLKRFPTVGENANQVRMAMSLKDITKPNAKIAIVMAGVTPYFLTDRVFVDLLGKSDKVIARQQSHWEDGRNGLQQYINYRPGHNKWDYQYATSNLRPDIFGQVWPESEIRHLEKNYREYKSEEGYIFYILKASKKVSTL